MAISCHLGSRLIFRRRRRCRLTRGWGEQRSGAHGPTRFVVAWKGGGEVWPHGPVGSRRRTGRVRVAARPTWRLVGVIVGEVGVHQRLVGCDTAGRRKTQHPLRKTNTIRSTAVVVGSANCMVSPWRGLWRPSPFLERCRSSLSASGSQSLIWERLRSLATRPQRACQWRRIFWWAGPSRRGRWREPCEETVRQRCSRTTRHPLGWRRTGPSKLRGFGTTVLPPAHKNISKWSCCCHLCCWIAIDLPQSSTKCRTRRSWPDQSPWASQFRPVWPEGFGASNLGARYGDCEESPLRWEFAKWCAVVKRNTRIIDSVDESLTQQTMVHFKAGGDWYFQSPLWIVRWHHYWLIKLKRDTLLEIVPAV